MTELLVGVAGVGALGQHHARVYASLPGVRLAAVYDSDPVRAAEVAARHGVPVAASFEDLLSRTQALSVAVPTLDHHRLAAQALTAGRDVLVEKPMTTTLAQADELIALAARHGRRLQVGHIERFNPVVDVLRQHAERPRFIEVHRLGAFSARSLDIDVVLDLMIHDLDVLLALAGAEPVDVEAVGVAVLTPRVDIANARLRFASGLIANLTASRVSAEKVRKFRVFAPSCYVSADFATREAQVYRLEPRAQGLPEIAVSRTAAPDEEPLRRQLAAFADAVRQRSAPLVPGAAGRQALALALRVLARVEEGSQVP
jgi:predicted dehydrogenase